MKGRWIIVALVLMAATAEETKLWRMAQTAFRDGMYDVTESQVGQLLQKFPGFELADQAQLLRARAQLEQGKWREAVEVLNEAIAKRLAEKRPDEFRYWLAEAFVRGEKYAEAESRYADLIERFPQSAYRLPAHYGLAFAAFKQGKLDAAAGTLERLTKLGAKAELAQEAELLRGQIKLAQGNFDQAEAILQAVVKKFPGSRAFYRAHIWLGESRSRSGRLDEAIKEYAMVTDAFRANPNKPVGAALAAEAWYGAGWAYWRQEKFGSAADAFAMSLQYAERPEVKRNAMLKLGESYVRDGKLAEGVARLKAFLQAHPADPLADELQLAVADLLFANGEYAGARTEYAQFITKFPQSALLARANLKAGWTAWRLNQPAEGLPYLQKAVALAADPSGKPADPATASEALFKLADTQFALGQNIEAIASYQRLISGFPDLKIMDRAVFQLGLAYWRTRNAEAAVATFESLIERYPNSERAAEAQFQIGLVHVGNGQEEKARAAFGLVVKNYPGNPWTDQAALAIGESYQREGRHDLAVAEFDRLIAAAADSELGQKAFYHRGWCFASSGQVDKTLADFTAFLVKYPQSPLAPDVQFWIGDYYLRRKDYLKSQEQYQSLAKIYATNELADTAEYYAARSAYLRQDYKTAIELYEMLMKSFPNSKWRCEARFGQGDALSELGQFDDALLVFDSILKQFPDCFLICDAQGRKGDCQFTLNRFEDAAASYRLALECARDADAATRNQLLYKIGQSLEKIGKLDEAFKQYAAAVYESVAVPDPVMPPERFWLCKAGMAAAGIKEQQQQWRDAITLYSRLLELCPDMKPVLEEKIRKLRVEKLIWF